MAWPTFTNSVMFTGSQGSKSNVLDAPFTLPTQAKQTNVPVDNTGYTGVVDDGLVSMVDLSAVLLSETAFFSGGHFVE